VLDDRGRYFRQLRRLRRSARRWSVIAAGFAGGSVVLVPYQGLGAWDAIWAGLAGGSAALAWWRWSDAREQAAQPVPDPRDPALAGDRWLSVLSQLPGGYNVAEHVRRQRTRGALRGSPAAGAWERLDRCAQTMRQLAGRLRESDLEAVTEASRVERGLRELTTRVADLEQALRVAPAPAQPPLRDLRADHVTQLELGVTAYEQFVVAAAGYLSESARAGVAVSTLSGLTEATERLRGVTAGLAELRGIHGDLQEPA
jgi:hypothetical protein